MSASGNRRRWHWAAVALIGVGLAASACGVPTTSVPIVDHTFPKVGPAPGVELSSPQPPDSFTDVKKFLSDGYLSVLGGTATAADEVKAVSSFLTPEFSQKLQDAWKGKAALPITVVRAVGDLVPNGGTQNNPDVNDVAGTFEIIGTFDPQAGMFSPAPAGTRKTVQFQVAQTNHRFRVKSAPAELFMSDIALATYYATETIYLWNSDQTILIPDLRYVPLSLLQTTPARVATQIVKWVLAGSASPWVSGATGGPFAPGLELTDPVLPVVAGAYQVDLQANAGALSVAELNLLSYQLRWSLGSLSGDPLNETAPVPSPIQLLINGSQRSIDNTDAYFENVRNLSPVRGRGAAVRYAVAGGAVYRVDLQHIPTVFSTINSVVSAAVNGSETNGAVVRGAPGNQSLWVGRMTGRAAPRYVEVAGLPKATLTRPQFLLYPPSTVAVAGGGKLYLVGPDNRARAVPIPANVGTVEAFAVSTDSQRLAFVADGNLYMSVLTVPVAGTTNAAVSVTSIHQVNVKPSLTAVSVVAWASTRQLAVGGNSTSGPALLTVNADGSNILQAPITFPNQGFIQISTYLSDPLTIGVSGEYDSPSSVLLQMSNGPFENSGRFLNEADVAGKPPSAPFYQD